MACNRPSCHHQSSWWNQKTASARKIQPRFTAIADAAKFGPCQHTYLSDGLTTAFLVGEFRRRLSGAAAAKMGYSPPARRSCSIGLAESPPPRQVFLGQSCHTSAHEVCRALLRGTWYLYSRFFKR